MQNKNCFKAADFLSGTSGSSSSVLAKVKAIDALEKKIHPALPAKLADDCRVANIHNGKLVLMVTNGMVATELRYQIPQLLTRLRTELKLHFIRNIEIIVRPASVKPPEPAPIKRTLTAQSAAVIRSIAADLDDPALKRALEKIAKHTG